jgi:hypothetical protein
LPSSGFSASSRMLFKRAHLHTSKGALTDPGEECTAFLFTADRKQPFMQRLESLIS